MDKKNNIYNYTPPKTMNEEVHYLLIKGRISFRGFISRALFASLLFITSRCIYFYYALPKKQEKLKILDDGTEVIYDSTFRTSFYIFENFTLYWLPFMLIIFITIQAVKRIHDVNKSGWYVLFPLYNILLIFAKGTDGNNDFGINPRPQKIVKYFDELNK